MAMIYLPDQINPYLICPVCGTTFNNPRILPCGQSLCYECLNKIIGVNDHIICEYCSEEHEVPRNGFPLNKVIDKLISNVKPQEIYRSKEVDELKDLLSELKNGEAELDNLMQNRVETVNTHCNSFREEIINASKDASKQLNEFKEELIAKILKYKEDRLNNLQRSKGSVDDVYKFVYDIDDFYFKKTNYLKQFKIDERDIQKALAESRIHLSNLEQKQSSLDKLIFGENNIEFQKASIKAENQIGSINFKSQTSHVLNIRNIKSLDLKRYFGSFTGNPDSICFNFIPNNRILMMIPTANYYISYYEFNLNGDLYNQNLNQISSSGSQIYFLKTSVLNGFIVCYVFYANNKSTLRIIDPNDNYNSRKSIDLDTQLISLASNSSYIYCLNESYTVVVYDEQLNKIKTFGQSYYLDRNFYIPISSKELQVNDRSMYVITDLDEIRVLNLSDGALERIIKIKTTLVSLYKDSLFISVDRVFKNLCCYDFDGKNVFEMKLSKFNPNMIKASMNNFLFFDSEEMILYLENRFN